MQAITTKHLPATDNKGSRIKAKSQAGSKTYSWVYEANNDENHRLAAQKYADKMGWGTIANSGILPDGETFVHLL